MDLMSNFDALQTAYKTAPYPSFSERQKVLLALKAGLQNEASHLIEAVNLDYGHRANSETFFEVFLALDTIRFCLKNLKSWMKDKKRKTPWYLKPAHAYLSPQPLGVVGIIAPYNYPIALSLIPIIYALAAGNRVMIKLSESSKNLASALLLLLDKMELNQHIYLTLGDLSKAEAFAALPFGHLLLTGSVAAGQNVMKIASHNLTPITLELGGKSPTVLSKTMNKDYFARLFIGKLLNAGQTCIAPDYLLIPSGWEDMVKEALQKCMATYYPNLMHNKDYSDIISTKQCQRLLDLVADAENQGARVIRFGEYDPQSKRLPFYVLFGVTPAMRVMQEEIFGPVLAVLSYSTFDEAIEYINHAPNPLVIYYFGEDKMEIQALKTNTLSGALSINDTMIHSMMNDLPFGGVGHSGMGCYHGQEGFDTFSQLKPIVVQSKLSLNPILYPPYSKFVYFLLAKLNGIKLN